MSRIIILFVLGTLGLSRTVNAEVQLITKPEPGHEYVFLQTSAAGSRPVERKEKPSQEERIFETAHKLPPSVTYALNQADAGESAKKPKREAFPGDAPAPAPAGAIKLDVQKLLEKYKTNLQTSTTPKPTNPSAKTTRRAGRAGNRRTKKEARDDSHVVVTSPSSILTTSSAGLRPVERDDDVPLVASGSEKQRSRIQIKKGPNGQEYEYEYVYYYYDDDEPNDKTDSKQSNAHEGPARNEISSRTRTGAASSGSAANEVLPASRSRTRGRQLEDEEVEDERLPSNTRFPPRSRNLSTSPSTPVDDEEEVKPARIRGRGRPDSTAATSAAVPSESDNVSDETQGTRGRTRANVRRPSLELVDSASFNTHTSSGEPPNGGPSFPSDLPAGPVRFLGATPNERADISADKKVGSDNADDNTEVEEATTMMNAMDKVALDLYAILQGTQRLSGEAEVDSEITTEADIETTTLDITTTEIPTTEITTPSTTSTTTPTTTTTTTTTTTPAPSTSAPESSFGRGKYRSRPGGIGNRKLGGAVSTTTTDAPQESKPKSRFNRPSFGSRPRARTTSAPTEQEQTEHKEEAKPAVSSSRTRTRFGATRTRVTTAAPEAGNEVTAAAASRSPLRPRPTFNLRGRTRPTSAATEASESSPATEESPSEASTTARSRPRINAANIRPLRPGPRINLSGGRGRLGGGSTTAAPEVPAEPAPVSEEDQEKPTAEEAAPPKEAETPAPDSNPLTRLRNRQRAPLQVRPGSPKAAASAPVQVRRVNPLLSRRKPIGEPATTEAPQEAPATEADIEEAATDAAPSSTTTTTTEEPKGLNKLLAGRRRLAIRQPGTIA